MDICVNLSLDETVDLLEKQILSSSRAKLIDKYIVDGAYVIVFNKYFLRVNANASLTLTIHFNGECTIVHPVAAGGHYGLAENDFGAGDKFTSDVEKILEQYLIK